MRNPFKSLIQPASGLVWLTLLMLLGSDPALAKRSVNIGNQSHANAPTAQQPTIYSLSPSTMHVGDPPSVLTVNGSNFASGADVYWNGVPRSGSLISASQLTATITSQELASPGVANVYLRNSTGPKSNTQTVSVLYATGMSITAHSPDPSIVGQPVMVSYSVQGGNRPTGSVRVYDVNDNTANCTGTVAGGSCSLKFNIPGSRILIAEYLGDSTNDGSKGGISHTVKGGTATLLTGFPTSATTVEQVVFTATVSSSLGGTPTGDVIFREGTTNLDTRTLINGTAVYSSTLLLGTHSITATYNGDSIYFPSTSGLVTITVNRPPNPPPVITRVDPNPIHVGSTGYSTLNIYGGQFVDLPTVYWNSIPKTVSFIAANQLQIVISSQDVASPGTAVVQVKDPDNSLSNDFYVAIKYATSVKITSHSPDPSGEGQPVTIAYTVSGSNPTGYVTVSDGSDSNTCSAAAGSCPLTLRTVGTRAIRAVYSGDANNDSSQSPEVQQKVKGKSTTVLSVSPDPGVEGYPIVLSAHVTLDEGGFPCTGDVEFYVGINQSAIDNWLGKESIFNDYAGHAATLPEGDYFFKAIYRGDPTCSTSMSTPPTFLRVKKPYRVFLPFNANNVKTGPDLAIVRFNVTADDVLLDIINKGNGEANTERPDRPDQYPVWVDVYFNPTSVPTGPHQICEDLGGQGVVWDITPAMPLPPNQILSLSFKGGKYLWHPPSDPPCKPIFPPIGTPVYVQVDTQDHVKELDESNNIVPSISVRAKLEPNLLLALGTSK